MKNGMKIFFMAAVLLIVAGECCLAQSNKLYTRRAKIEDFATRTTKVVTGGHSLPELSLREEIITRWRISPFEFCTPDEYNELGTDSNLYFLFFSQSEGVMYLTLSKGGAADAADKLKRSLDVVSIPIASAGDPSGRELMLMGAFVDILQNYMEEAIISESTAYEGLEYCNSANLKGKTVVVNSESVDSLYRAGAADTLIGLTVASSEFSGAGFCYKMLISCDTHELMYFRKVKGSGDEGFTKADLKRIKRRNGVISQ